MKDGEEQVSSVERDIRGMVSQDLEVVSDDLGEI